MRVSYRFVKRSASLAVFGVATASGVAVDSWRPDPGSYGERMCLSMICRGSGLIRGTISLLLFMRSDDAVAW